jgi:hypothetical protein
MSSAEPCEYCGYDVPASSDRCPHCARPSRFPNVIAAKNPAEQDALALRHQAALNRADPAVAAVLQQFATAVGKRSQAVIARYATEMFALAANDKALYASFYELVQAKARLPSDNFWDSVRGVVDEKLFTHYKEHIRFAALSLDGRGLRRYGDCFFVLKEAMIAHRATVFEENSVVFMDRLKLPLTAELPTGHRALWQDRGRLAVVKLADAISPNLVEGDFPALLIRDGTKPEDDQFIEVHVYGPFSIHSVAAVSQQTRGSAVRHKALREKLAKFGIPLTEL